MRTLPRVCALAAHLLLPLSAQAIELRTGEVLTGRPMSVAGDRVTVQVHTPKPERREIALADLEPRAAYAILSARTAAGDGPAHFVLGEASDRLGLPTYAIAAFAEAARLDPSLRAAAEAQVKTIRERVAMELMRSAADALTDGHWGTAKLTAQVVAQRYGDTKAGAGAKDLVRDAVARGRSAAGATGTSPTPPAAVQKALAAAQHHEDKANAIELPATVGFTVKEQRQREQVIKHLEAAWRDLGTVNVTGDAAGTAFTATRERVKDKLSKNYVAMARTLIQRRALNQAEDWNALACKLDPEGGGCQQTQDLIVQARLTTGYGF